MGLLPCPACAKQVSEETTGCPGCGQPITAEIVARFQEQEALRVEARLKSAARRRKHMTRGALIFWVVGAIRTGTSVVADRDAVAVLAQGEQYRAQANAWRESLLEPHRQELERLGRTIDEVQNRLDKAKPAYDRGEDVLTYLRLLDEWGWAGGPYQTAKKIKDEVEVQVNAKLALRPDSIYDDARAAMVRSQLNFKIGVGSLLAGLLVWITRPRKAIVP